MDLAVAVADGATTICDIAVLADQEALFGAVASDSRRLLDQLEDADSSMMRVHHHDATAKWVE